MGYPSKMSALPDIVLSTAERHRMLPEGAPVIVMVSGGADSVTMLHLFASEVLGKRPLRVLHVNHQLRGDDSDGDESFVRDLCERLGVDLRVARYDVAAYAHDEGLNLEDAGRRIRYRFAEDELDALCEQQGLATSRGRIAVAHTLDDRIETFFSRAICGAGTGALGSIAPARDRIVRPLIECERSAVRGWLEDLGESWREDASNADTRRQRALVRAEILPVAEKLNPSFRASIARTMDLLADDDALLTGMAEAFARDFAEVSDGRVSFGRDWMRTLDRTMARRTIRSALSRAFPEGSRLEAAHIEALVDGLIDDQFSRDLPFGMRAVSEYDSMVVSRRDEDIPRVAPSLLLLPGTVDLGTAGRMSAELVEKDDFEGDADSVVIDIGAVSGELVVDSFRPGDRMRPLGMQGTRKLSDLLIDAKVPRRLRGAYPVVRDGDRIVWLAGIRMSDGYRIVESTESAVRLTWFRSPEVHGQIA